MAAPLLADLASAVVPATVRGVNTSLDHLPDRKRRDLERIVEILFAEFSDATALATQGWKKQGRILKIVLFGSYARGDWVEDPKGGYFSDYDVLVVVSDRRLTDAIEYWAKADDHLMRAVTIEKSISAPVNFIVHDLADVNEQLRHGRPFFVDIVRDGIALYEMEGIEFDQPKPLPPAQQREEAQRYFSQWFLKAETAFKGARFYIQEGDVNDAAFLLHQTTERLYHCVLLVLTLYSPLCRARHNGLYAERRTMPSGRGFSLLASRMRVVSSA